jgi:hypothetical protein
MADGFDLKIDTAEMDKKLSELPLKVRRQAIRKSLAAGGEILAESMAAHAPERTDEATPGSTALPPGVLKEDIGWQVQAKADYAPRVKVGTTTIAAHVANWIENGWDMTGPSTNHNGKFIKHVDGIHFMAAAFDESIEAAIDAALESLGDALNDED